MNACLVCCRTLLLALVAASAFAHHSITSEYDATVVIEIAGTLLGAMIADLTGALVGWLAALGLGAVWVMTGGRRRRPAPRSAHRAASAADVPPTRVGVAR